MKRAIRLIMCAAMIVALLVVSAAPVAAASSATKTGSFAKSGATVSYYLVKGWLDGSGYLWGLTAATLESDYWTSATLKISAGVKYYEAGYWWTWTAWQPHKSLNPGHGGTVTDMVYSPPGIQTGGDSRYAITLRMVLVSKNWPFGFVKGWDSRCYTWQYPDSTLTRDYATEDELETLEGMWGLVYMLSKFMTAGLSIYG